MSYLIPGRITENWEHGIDLRPNQSHMTIGHPQREAKLKLSRMGYKLTNTYGDGVINVTNPNTDVMIFISEDGSISPPRTYDTMVASVQLWEAGIELTYPEKKE